MITEIRNARASDQYVKDNIAGGTVILADGELAGLCVCKENAIDLMMIDHRLQGRGLGTRLLEHCEAEMFARHELLTLKSFTRNERANAFYAKNGWVAGETFVDQESGYAMVRFDKPRGDTPASS